MHILFQDGTRVAIQLNNSSLSRVILGVYKHLQHVEIPFRAQGYDNPYYFNNINIIELSASLVKFGKDLGIDVNQTRCINRDQDYFNHLHKIYEKEYDGRPTWLDFHEHIHMCESYDKKNYNVLSLNYREKAGPLEKKFEHKWLEESTTKLEKGDVFVSWAELGKTPYSYWVSHESDDIDRLCELAKPWLKFKPRLSISFDEIDMLDNKNVEMFEQWWPQYHDDWCKHWGLTTWTIHQMYSANVVGKCTELDKIQELLSNNIYPTRVQLS